MIRILVEIWLLLISVRAATLITLLGGADYPRLKNASTRADDAVAFVVSLALAGFVAYALWHS